mmetsp:Transcript_13981/g.16462  ORF Transcript_13981/g.16462 Transcript_13981/m.16462 type:complete len:476 (+) Transcript_13981:405-1832(+)
MTASDASFSSSDDDSYDSSDEDEYSSTVHAAIRDGDSMEIDEKFIRIWQRMETHLETNGGPLNAYGISDWYGLLTTPVAVMKGLVERAHLDGDRSPDFVKGTCIMYWVVYYYTKVDQSFTVESIPIPLIKLTETCLAYDRLISQNKLFLPHIADWDGQDATYLDWATVTFNAISGAGLGWLLQGRGIRFPQIDRQMGNKLRLALSKGVAAWICLILTKVGRDWVNASAIIKLIKAWYSDPKILEKRAACLRSYLESKKIGEIKQAHVFWNSLISNAITLRRTKLQLGEPFSELTMVTLIKSNFAHDPNLNVAIAPVKTMKELEKAYRQTTLNNMNEKDNEVFKLKIRRVCKIDNDSGGEGAIVVYKAGENAKPKALPETGRSGEIFKGSRQTRPTVLPPTKKGGETPGKAPGTKIRSALERNQSSQKKTTFEDSPKTPNAGSKLNGDAVTSSPLKSPSIAPVRNTQLTYARCSNF